MEGLILVCMSPSFFVDSVFSVHPVADDVCDPLYFE
jgi:hypothetical protein